MPDRDDKVAADRRNFLKLAGVGTLDGRSRIGSGPDRSGRERNSVERRKGVSRNRSREDVLRHGTVLGTRPFDVFVRSERGFRQNVLLRAEGRETLRREKCLGRRPTGWR